MKKYNSIELRKKWLDFFESKDHLVLESKSLVPNNDPSLLWINSGVATLKDFFSGKKIPPSKRLTNSQKCIRTNDIENVGMTSRHHTFFEMLGNFSIGDYFKEEAIEFAYEFLINVLEMDVNNLYFTTFNEDDIAYKKWIDLGISKDKIFKLGRDTNFWDVGSGPCGPDTEIFYDRGEKYDKRGPELISKDIENDRFIEIWNVVFSEFNNDGNNNYEELKQKNIDTGAGFERLLSILQNGHTNFDTDLFLPIINEAGKYTDKKYDSENYFKKDTIQKVINKNFKIISDHIRAVVMAIGDGVKPSNNSMGYIIRRLIRRAYRSGIQLGISGSFLYKLVNVVQGTLPIYKVDIKEVQKVIKDEEELFSRTLNIGEDYLKNIMNEIKGVISSEVAFKLYETYGFPVELTKEIVEENNREIDLSKFEEFKLRHMQISNAGKTSIAMAEQIKSFSLIESKISEFIGYEEISAKSKVIKILNENESLDKSNNEEVFLVLDKTPFYATSGGQTFDLGTIAGYEVIDVIKDKYGNHIHKIKGTFNLNQDVECVVFDKVRKMQESNHTANHLLYAGLRKVLGDHIKQLGSYNDNEKIRFDFPNDTKPTEKEVKQIEDFVNEHITRSIDREYILTNKDDAIKMGASFLEDEDYGDNVRVVKFGDVIDLCGGTHIKNTHDIEKFKITSIDKKGSRVFRVEAITSQNDIDKFNKMKIEELNTELTNIINKTKSLDKKYDLKISLSSNLEQDVDTLQKLILKAREEYKKVVKESKNVSELPEEISTIDIKNKKYYIDTSYKGNIKSFAIGLREKFKDVTFIIGSDNNVKTPIVIASNVEDSKMILDLLSSKIGGAGGGFSKNAQGALNGSNLKDKIIEVLNNA